MTNLCGLFLRKQPLHTVILCLIFKQKVPRTVIPRPPRNLAFAFRPRGKSFTAGKRSRDELPMQGPSADFAGRLNYKGRPQDDKFMRAVSAQTTPPHSHPEASAGNSGILRIGPRTLYFLGDLAVYS